MTKICLINTPVPELKDDRLDVPVGLLYIGTHLKNRGYDVEICDLAGIPREQWVSTIPYANYYGFSTYTCNIYLTWEIKELCRRINPLAPMIAGGAHATGFPEHVKELGFDYVVVGEGEGAIESIIEEKEGWLVKPAPILNLDKLPYINYDMIDVNSYHRKIENDNGEKVVKAISVFSSRGCPYNCAFCSSKAIDYGWKYRKRSVKHFVGEIENIKRKYGIKHFRIKDDLFTHDIKWLREFNEMVDILSLSKDNIPLKYDCLVRAGYHKEVPQLLKDSGCTMVSIGIESGSNVVLKAMNKGTRRSVNIESIQRMRDAGIKVLIWLIVGFPSETWDSVKETVDMVNEAKPDITTIYPLIPYPGTDVWRNPDKYGIRITDTDFSHYYYIKGNYDAGYVYETDTLNPIVIENMRQYMIENITESDIR